MAKEIIDISSVIENYIIMLGQPVNVDNYTHLTNLAKKVRLEEKQYKQEIENIVPIEIREKQEELRQKSLYLRNIALKKEHDLAAFLASYKDKIIDTGVEKAIHALKKEPALILLSTYFDSGNCKVHISSKFALAVKGKQLHSYMTHIEIEYQIVHLEMLNYCKNLNQAIAEYPEMVGESLTNKTNLLIPVVEIVEAYKDFVRAENLMRERLEKERLEKERLEKERLEKERLEKERLEKERLEKERLEGLITIEEGFITKITYPNNFMTLPRDTYDIPETVIGVRDTMLESNKITLHFDYAHKRLKVCVPTRVLNSVVNGNVFLHDHVSVELLED